MSHKRSRKKCGISLRVPLQALVSAMLLGAVIASAQIQTQPLPQPPAPGASAGYIVTFQPGVSRGQRATSVQRAGAPIRFNYSAVEAAAINIPNTAVRASLQSDPSIVEIIPDRVVQAFSQTVPEGVKRVGEHTTGSSDGTGVGVAIVDTGIDLAHADLAVAAQKFSAYGDTCQDVHGHGTHVAGITAALDNALDVVGVAPAAKPYCVKVLDNSGSGTDSAVMAGLDWVWLQNGGNTPLSPLPIGVVNMSLGREGALNDNPALRAIVQKLYNQQVVIVVSAGNDPSKEVKDMIPAGYPEVLAVGSTTAKGGTNAGCPFFSGTILADTASYFTTDGKLSPQNIGVTISSPGEDQENVTASCTAVSVGILSLRAGGGTTRMSGTSQAAPHVSGIVARLLQQGYSGVENIRNTLRSTADRPNVAPLNSPTSGYSFDTEREGIAKAPAPPAGPTPPTVDIVSPAEGSTVSGNITIRIQASDAQDAPGTLTVQWNVDGGIWRAAAYNSGTGYYQASGNSALIPDGSHTLNARATDSTGLMGTDSNHFLINNVNDLPVAAFTFSCSNLACNFDGSGSTDPDGSILSYSWNFGNGSTGSGAVVSHTYAAGGTYTVVLTVTDNNGANDTESKSVTVTGGQTNTPPTVNIVNPAEGATVSGTIIIRIQATDAQNAPGTLTVQWNVDGGVWRAAAYNSGTGYYQASGNSALIPDGPHTINARATDSQGATGTDSNGFLVDN